MGQVVKLNKSLYVLRQKNGAIVEFTNVMDTAYSARSAGGTVRGDFVPRGKKDDVLSRMHKLMTESPNKLRLIKTRRDFVIAKGLKTRRTIVDDLGRVHEQFEVRNLAFEAFRRRVDLDPLLSEAGLQQAFCNDVFIKLTLDLKKKVEELEVLDSFHVRARRLKPGERKVTAWIFNPNFGTKNYRKDQSEVYPAFDPKEPTKHPVSVIHLRDKIPGQFYYQIADWWGTEAWSKVANKIPVFHDAGLDNGYNIKYHISLPDNYFAKDGLSEDEQEALKIETLDSMGDSLAGIENVDKVLFTFNPIGPDGKPIEGVKITPLKNEMSDDAYTALFLTANIAQASGHGVLPVLAGIDTGGKLGGSGKELEAAANYMQAFLTKTDREILLQLFKYLGAIEAWESDLEFFFEDVKLYNYDVTPTRAEQNPNQPKLPAPNDPDEDENDEENDDATKISRAA